MTLIVHRSEVNGVECTITGSVEVTVESFPAVQPVSDNGSSLTVDGTVTANAGTGPFPVSDNGGSLTVDGTVSVGNFPAIQPVATVPLGLTPAAPGTAAVTNSAGGSSLISSNANRRGAAITNTSSLVTISLSFNGGTPVAGSGVVLNPGGVFSMDAFTFTTGEVKGIASGVGGSVGIQEWSV